MKRTQPKKYHSVTASINADGSPSIIAWYRESRRLRFDSIPLHSAQGVVLKITEVKTANPSASTPYPSILNRAGFAGLA